MLRSAIQLIVCIVAVQAIFVRELAAQPALSHPRLYFTAEDLPKLRELRSAGAHARIWDNLIRSADWCAQQAIRQEWIAPIADDPQFENLYDRFYAAMHDTAIVEHLALTSALSDPGNDPYFEPAKAHLLAAARVWRREADEKPDASKAYAVLRIVKAMAVGYDSLYERLDDAQRKEIRDAIVAVARDYFEFFQDPLTAGEGYNKHHGSVDAAPFGVIALALLGEVDEAQAWLDLAVKKHVDYLLPHALTPSGASEDGTTFYASTLQYRMLFLDPLRRVTGRDLLAEFPDGLPGQLALASVAAGQPSGLDFNENYRSVVSAPCYAQLDYWSPVLLYLARREQRPIYQHLALWDESLGSLQRTRFVTPNRKEELLFTFGPYAYLWCDASVNPAIEEDLPHAFLFPEPKVNAAYLRASYRPCGIVVGLTNGTLVVHAGGRPVLAGGLYAASEEDPPVAHKLLLTDDGRRAVIRCAGPDGTEADQQQVVLERPSKLTIKRTGAAALSWWYSGNAQQDGQSFAWPDGTRLTIVQGNITAVVPDAMKDVKVHYAGMKFADPNPFSYPIATAEPVGGSLIVEIVTPH